MNLDISKGKTLIGEWIEGYYIYDDQLETHNIYKRGSFFEISPTSLCRCTGRKSIKGRPLFENDIVFDEVAEDYGDRRIYYVCKWINEWSKFVFLSYGELYQYEDGGVGKDGLQDDGTFSIDSAENYHYAGNYIDNPDLLLD